jgi:site-specific DNA recombinase
VLLDVNDVALGHTAVMRWNTKEQWVTSKDLAHEALISDDDYTRVQDLLSSRARRRNAVHKPHRSRHPYLFKSLIYCAICQRRMQGQHSHGIAYYRCRFPQEYALANKIQHPRKVIMREEALILPLDQWLDQAFSPTRREHTLAVLAEQAAVGLSAPTPATDDSIITQYDARIERYRAALDAGTDPVLVAGWIAETQAERQRALARTRTIPRSPQEVSHLSAEDIAAILDELGDLITALNEAEPTTNSRSTAASASA